MNNEIPPANYTNRISELRHAGELRADYDHFKYRSTPEWKMFVAGFNAAVEKCNGAILSQYNMGETSKRVFGGK
jgi:hypothetical protein